MSIFSALRKQAVKKVNMGSWEGIFNNPKAILFTINTVPILVNDFIDYILTNQIAGSDFDKMYQNFVNERLLIFEEAQLQDKYPEYNHKLLIGFMLSDKKLNILN